MKAERPLKPEETSVQAEPEAPSACLAGASASPAATVAASFEVEVKKFESGLIKRALEEANGSVTRAAKILGLTHQGLCYIINHRHKDLLTARAPIRVRRKSVLKKR